MACSRGMKYLGLLPPTTPSSWPNRQEEGVDSLGPSKKNKARRAAGVVVVVIIVE